MVASTRWYGEFVAGFAGNSAVLGEPQVLNIRGPSAADKPRHLEFDTPNLKRGLRFDARA